MPKNCSIILIIILVLIISSGCSMIEKTGKEKAIKKSEDLPVRQPAVAGSFYPADPNELKAMIEDFLSQSSDFKTGGKPKILVIPHAGYSYSGKIAALAYKAIKDQDYSRVILIGPSHTTYLPAISVYPKGYYQTPLGKIRVDEDLAGEILKSSDRIDFIPEAHVKEHDLEVQLPFLQVALGGFSVRGGPAPGWQIVPILVSQDSGSNIETLVKALKDNIDDKTLVVISSDLSHYPEYGVANEADNKVVEAILTKDTNELDKTIQELMSQGHAGLDTTACGEAAIKVGMELARELGLEGQLLKYANSGDVTGDYSRVVGYASIVFTGGGSKASGEIRKLDSSEIKATSSEAVESDTRGGLPAEASAKAGADGANIEDWLSQENRERLVKIARETLEEYLSTGDIPKVQIESEALNKKLGAFVTLRTKSGQLRGCIGRFSPTDIPLYEVVQQMAIAAATEDIRFTPVGREELEELKIEISVLSNLTKIDDWHQIELGKHGVEVVQGMRKGVFLPQVATDNNWDLETFMNELCESKAGISRDAWKTGKAEIYVFTAQVFSEE